MRDRPASRGDATIKKSLDQAVAIEDGWRQRLSQHGAKRLQQRGIGLPELAMVMAYGTEQRARGATRFYLDQQSWRHIAEDVRADSTLLTRADIQVVVADDGRIITVAHRTRRLRRDIQARWSRPRVH